MKIFFKSLYGKIALVFLSLMILITLIQVYLTFHSCKSFMNEMEQRLNFPLAHKLALSLQPHLNPPHKAEIAKIVQEFLKHSPGIDIYLLDQNYRVVASLTREEHQFVTTQISAAPIEKSLQPNPMLPIVAEDPLSTRKCIFSISPIRFNGHESGFLYIILNEHSNTSSLQMLSESYIVQSAIKTVGLTFLLSIGVGLFSFALITRRLKKITRAVQDFENGNLPEPIKISTQDEVGQLARAFNQMAGTIVDHLKEIQRQEKLKNELVANISHDIRSPLTILQGYVETMMLKESLLTPEVRRQYLEKIFNNTQELNKLVDELFELSRLENQDIHPQPEAFSLQELIHDILLDYLPIAERRKIQLDLQSPPTLPFVVGDLKMIQRAITHLLDNALAFTPQGGKVTIALNMMKDGINVTISDTGEGISTKDLPYIFERSFRVDRSRSRGHRRGAGLGLAITRKILELHDSAISVRSTIHKGTTFSFQLPLYSP